MAMNKEWLCRLVLAVHRRNGGQLQELDTTLRLLDPALRLDSLDLAEIMVAIERETGQSPFDSAVPPRTWDDLLRAVESPQGPPRQTNSQRS